MNILMLYSKIICGRVQSHIKPHPSLILYCNIIITYSIHIVSTNVYMYSLISINLISLTNEPSSLVPPNSIIQLVVGVSLQTERECQYLLVTLCGILVYIIKNNDKIIYLVNKNDFSLLLLSPPLSITLTKITTKASFMSSFLKTTHSIICHFIIIEE